MEAKDRDPAKRITYTDRHTPSARQGNDFAGRVLHKLHQLPYNMLVFLPIYFAPSFLSPVPPFFSGFWLLFFRMVRKGLEVLKNCTRYAAHGTHFSGHGRAPRPRQARTAFPNVCLLTTKEGKEASLTLFLACSVLKLKHKREFVSIRLFPSFVYKVAIRGHGRHELGRAPLEPVISPSSTECPVRATGRRE